HQGVVVPAHEIDVVELDVSQLLDRVLERGAADGRAGLAGQVGDGTNRALLGHDDHHPHAEVGLGEVDLRPPLRGDAEGAPDHVPLAPEEGGDELGKGRLDGKDLQGDPERLGKSGHDVVVDPGDVAEATVHVAPDEGALHVGEGEHDELAPRL